LLALIITLLLRFEVFVLNIFNNAISVTGGIPLYGEVNNSGAKNAAVAVAAAAMAVDGVCLLENVPAVGDVETLLRIEELVGAGIDCRTPGICEIDARYVIPTTVAPELYNKLRASYYLLGAMLGRFGYAKVAMPGGCDFGLRPIDLHEKGFRALGATVTNDGSWIEVKSDDARLKGAYVYLDTPSVGATINIMLAAVHADGLTTIDNAAREPHIIDVANFLNLMGAEISGAGSGTIKITGKDKLHGGTYTLIPDQLEAGTYLAAVMGTGGDVVLKNVIPRHLECIVSKLLEMGAEVADYGDAVRISRDPKKELRRTNVKTMPYPGFPTDMQPQITTLLTLARGTSIVTETVWESRFQYVEQLRKMGAKITVEGMRTAVIEGDGVLRAAAISAPDLRAGAAMVIAGLCAEGTTVISDVTNIERGYENIVEKLCALGAKVVRPHSSKVSSTKNEIGDKRILAMA